MMTLIKFLIAAGIGLGVAAPVAGQTSCASYPNTFTSGETASASQVNANFACAALLGGNPTNFTGTVAVNNPSPSTGSVVSVTPTGNDWNEGIEINPSTNGYGALAFRATANSVTNGWEIFKASPIDGTGPNSLSIGLNGLAGMSGTGRVDTPFSITTSGVSRFGGPVGIGATDPTLGGLITTVFTAVNSVTAIAAAYNTSTPSFALNPLSNGGWSIYDHGGDEWRVDLAGLDGGVSIGGGGSPGPTFYVNGTAGGPDAWEVTSDARLKTKVQPITGALELIIKLQGVRYEWKPQEQREVGKALPLPLDTPKVGFIAQDVAKVVPEAVAMPKAGPDGIYGLREDNLIPFLVEAIKSQQAEIKDLQAEVAALKAPR